MTHLVLGARAVLGSDPDCALFGRNGSSPACRAVLAAVSPVLRRSSFDQIILKLVPRLLDSTDTASMCAGSIIPDLHLPDHQLVAIEHLLRLLEVGQVCMTGDLAVQLFDLCCLLQIKNFFKEELESVEDIGESVEAALEQVAEEGAALEQIAKKGAALEQVAEEGTALE